MIERVTHVVNGINAINVFVVVTLLFQLLSKHSLAALLCKQCISKRLYAPKNDSFVHYTHTHIVSIVITNFFTVKY